MNASIQERVDSGMSASNSAVLQSESQHRQATHMSGSDSHHLAVELADWKSRLRKQRQEL